MNQKAKFLFNESHGKSYQKKRKLPQQLRNYQPPMTLIHTTILPEVYQHPYMHARDNQIP